MKNSSKYFDIVPTNIPNVFLVISKGNGFVMLQYRISPQGTVVQNMELAMSLIATFEDYCKTVQKEAY